MNTITNELPPILSLTSLVGPAPKDVADLHAAASKAASAAGEALNVLRDLDDVSQSHLRNLDEDAGIKAALAGKRDPGQSHLAKWEADRAKAYADACSLAVSANGLIAAANAALQKAAPQMREAVIALAAAQAAALVEQVASVRDDIVKVQQQLNEANYLERVAVGPKAPTPNQLDLHPNAAVGLTDAAAALSAIAAQGVDA